MLSNRTASALRLASCLLGAAVATASAAISTAAAQSFNCSKPESRRCPEVVICQTPQLARLDESMSSQYFLLQSMASRRGADFLLKSQRSWLAGRNSCGCNANCLIDYYEQRIAQFRSVLDQ